MTKKNLNILISFVKKPLKTNIFYFNSYCNVRSQTVFLDPYKNFDSLSHVATITLFANVSKKIYPIYSEFLYST